MCKDWNHAGINEKMNVNSNAGWPYKRVCWSLLIPPIMNGINASDKTPLISLTDYQDSARERLRLLLLPIARGLVCLASWIHFFIYNFSFSLLGLNVIINIAYLFFFSTIYPDTNTWFWDVICISNSKQKQEAVKVRFLWSSHYDALIARCVFFLWCLQSGPSSYAVSR